MTAPDAPQIQGPSAVLRRASHPLSASTALNTPNTPNTPTTPTTPQTVLSRGSIEHNGFHLDRGKRRRTERDVDSDGGQQVEEEDDDQSELQLLLTPPHFRARTPRTYAAITGSSLLAGSTMLSEAGQRHTASGEAPLSLSSTGLGFSRSRPDEGVMLTALATVLFSVMAVMVRVAESSLQLSVPRALFVRAATKLFLTLASLPFSVRLTRTWPSAASYANGGFAGRGATFRDDDNTAMQAGMAIRTDTDPGAGEGQEQLQPGASSERPEHTEVLVSTAPPTSALPMPMPFSERAALLCTRAAAGTAALTCYLVSMKLLPAGDALAGAFIVPVLTVLAAHIGLGERISRMHGFAAVFGACGVVLLGLPEMGADARAAKLRVVGAGCALGCAFFSAISYVAVRRLDEQSSRGDHEGNHEEAGSGTGGGGVGPAAALGTASVVTAIVLGGFVTPAQIVGDDSARAGLRDAVALIAGAGVVAAVGQSWLRRGLREVRGRPGILIRNAEVPLVYALAFVTLGELPTVVHAAGAALVVTASLVIGVEHLVRA